MNTESESKVAHLGGIAAAEQLEFNFCCKYKITNVSDYHRRGLFAAAGLLISFPTASYYCIALKVLSWF